MKLHPTITLAVIPPAMLLSPNALLLTNPQVRKVLFFLQVVQDQKRCFYECSQEGCSGCGCPSFVLDETLEIPDWVLDHLRLHVRSHHSAIAGSD